MARLREQQEMDKGTHGMLTVRLQFVQDTLKIEVMNARNLKPMDSNGEKLCEMCNHKISKRSTVLSSEFTKGFVYE